MIWMQGTDPAKFISWRPGPRRGEDPSWICLGSGQERAAGAQSPQALQPPEETWVNCVRSPLLT